MSTADDYLIFATFLAIMRALILRRTLVVTIRAEHVLDRSGVKASARFFFYRFLRDAPLIKTFSIMPHEVEERLAWLTNASIHDPAFFELQTLDCYNGYSNRGVLPPGRLPDQVVFLGAFSESRNIRTFINLFSSRNDIIAIAKGRRSRDLPDDALWNSGRVHVVEGHLSNSDFKRALVTAQSVWCAFRPEYDNFSGVFCNAVRFGIPVWVTRGSRLSRFAELHEGKEVCRLYDNRGQVYILYQNISLKIAELKQENYAALK